MTLTIQIGNSDNKLPQDEWSAFIQRLISYFEHISANIHFTGGSSPEQAWQNYCVVVDVEEESLNAMFEYVAFIAKRHHQDSIAVTRGTTEFISPKTHVPRDLYA